MVERIIDIELKRVYLRCWWCAKLADYYQLDNDRPICDHCLGQMLIEESFDEGQTGWISDLDEEKALDISKIEKMWEVHLRRYKEEGCLKLL